MPNINELMSLMNFSTQGQVTWLSKAPESGPGFTNIVATTYWTSTTVASNTSNAYTVNMSNGNISNATTKTAASSNLLPVRDGQ